MSTTLVRSKGGKSWRRHPPKAVCIHRGGRVWLPLDARVNFTCKCASCPAYPGACIEDWRAKKVVCKHYEPKV